MTTRKNWRNYKEGKHITVYNKLVVKKLQHKKH